MTALRSLVPLSAALLLSACVAPSGATGGGGFVPPAGDTTSGDSGASSGGASSGGTSSGGTSSGGTTSGGASSGGTTSGGASSGGTTSGGASSGGSSSGSTSSACPNGKCEPGETAQSCPKDCLDCFQKFSIGSTFYKSNDTSQVGAACSPKGHPKNCPDGYWIDFKDNGDCICVVSCAAFSTPKKVGDSCNTSGSWKCQEITNHNGSKGKFCVPTKWGLCTTDGGSSSGGTSSGGTTSGGSSSGGTSSGGTTSGGTTSGGSSSGGSSSGGSSSSGGGDCKKFNESCSADSQCCSGACDLDFGTCDL